MEAVVNAGDGHGLGSIPVGSSEGKRVCAQEVFCCIETRDGNRDISIGLSVEDDGER